MWAWLVLLGRLPGMSTDLSADASLSVRVTRYPSRNSLLVTNTAKRGQALLTLVRLFARCLRWFLGGSSCHCQRLCPRLCFFHFCVFIGVLFPSLGCACAWLLSAAPLVWPGCPSLGRPVSVR